MIVNPRNGMLWYNYGHELEDRAQLESPGKEQERLLGQAWAAFHRASILDPLSGDASTMMVNS